MIAALSRAGYSRVMSTIALTAHFDGKQIVLDEPFQLPVNASLLVTILPQSDGDIDDRQWLAAASKSDAFAFLNDDSENIYTSADGQPYSDDE